jgi:DnaJ-domain-containing protein 1
VVQGGEHHHSTGCRLERDFWLSGNSREQAKMAAEVTIDYYAVLQVSPSADRHTIRSSYFKLAKRYHPDKNINNPNATALSQSSSLSL